jgi:hypothetical protein
MRRAAVVLLPLAATISDQVPVTVGEAARLRKDFALRAGEQTLNCEVKPRRYRISIRGRVFHVPQSQYSESDGDY